MQTEMPPNRAENSTGSLDVGGIAQELLGASKKDCNNSRDFFIPRAKLVEIINPEHVGHFLQTISEERAEDANHRQDVVQLICPGPGECFCGCGHCLGLRMILATLFLCGRERIISSFLFPKEARTCDNNLHRLFYRPEDRKYGLQSDQIELFSRLRWQVYTPFITGITSARRDEVHGFPDEVSLPWMEKRRIGEPATGDVSYVEKIAIHDRNHNLVSWTVRFNRPMTPSSDLYKTPDKTAFFALKVFEQRLAPGLSKDRFVQEVEANLDAPEHDRIVRLLTAFSYRKRFYLLFPFANEGSLETLWRTYHPDGIVQTPTQSKVADWYSDVWLIGECLGIAEALLATHSLIGDHPDEENGLLHADIKPENILCFPESKSGKLSIVLKLADFGEAKRVKPDLKASKAAHVLTYRPPEHSSGNILTLQYDVWCLGCLFLDFINWAIFGQDGIDSFIRDRMNEQHEASVTEVPGQITEDTFFKRIQQHPVPSVLKRWHWGHRKEKKVGSGRATTIYSVWASSHVKVTSQLKDTVVSRVRSLQSHPKCSDLLKRLLSFISERMLVVDPGRRAYSREVRDFLTELMDER